MSVEQWFPEQPAELTGGDQMWLDTVHLHLGNREWLRCWLHEQVALMNLKDWFNAQWSDDADS